MKRNKEAKGLGEESGSLLLIKKKNKKKKGRQRERLKVLLHQLAAELLGSVSYAGLSGGGGSANPTCDISSKDNSNNLVTNCNQLMTIFGTTQHEESAVSFFNNFSKTLINQNTDTSTGLTPLLVRKGNQVFVFKNKIYMCQPFNLGFFKLQSSESFRSILFPPTDQPLLRNKILVDQDGFQYKPGNNK